MLAFALGAGTAGAQEPGPVEWPYVGADQTHSKYSALADIDRANVADLEIAWEWDAGEFPLPEYGTRPGRFEATPLMIDDTLYVSTMYARVVALDAETGDELWRFDPDKTTGEEVWRGATPFPTSGNPMTYRTRSGRQLVAIATGAGPDAALVAFALPE